MPFKWQPPDLQDLIDRYISGESPQALSARYGVMPATIKSRLKEAGVRLRTVAEGRYASLGHPIPDEAAVADLYARGISAATVATKFGIHESTVVRIARRHEVPIRTHDASLRLTLAQMSVEDRQRIFGDPHRGRPSHSVSEDEARRRALAREGRFLVTNNSEGEAILREWLIEVGWQPIVNKAIGPYNADLGAAPVAVEVFSGNRHGHGLNAARFPKRCRYILNAGWNLVVVWRCLFFPLTRGASEYLIAFIEESRGDPAFRRQYRVIGGNGQELLAHGGDFDDFAFVPPGC